MRQLHCIPCFLLLLLALSGCRTTEANYREAYQKTIAGRDSADIDNSIYGRTRRQYSKTDVATDSGTVEVIRRLVRVTDGGGATPENLKRYNVVGGEFKQIFNARSFRNRLVDNGYPGAFIVESGEPYYYIVVQSFDSPTEAAALKDRLSASPPFTFKAPCPYILDATARK